MKVGNKVNVHIITFTKHISMAKFYHAVLFSVMLVDKNSIKALQMLFSTHHWVKKG